MPSSTAYRTPTVTPTKRASRIAPALPFDVRAYVQQGAAAHKGQDAPLKHCRSTLAEMKAAIKPAPKRLPRLVATIDPRDRPAQLHRPPPGSTRVRLGGKGALAYAEA
jgi:hypothetical protein